MTTQILVRQAHAFDASALFELVRQFAVSFVPARAEFERSFERLLDDEDAWIGLAEGEGEIIGYCLGFEHDTFYANGRVGWVEEIMVRTEFRQRGVGRALMDAFEERATLRGARLIAVATRRASAFYAALGYEESAAYFRKLL